MNGAISFSQWIDQSNGSQSISTAALTNFCTRVCYFKFMAFCKTQKYAEIDMYYYTVLLFHVFPSEN